MLSFSYPNLSSRHPIVLYRKHMVKCWKTASIKSVLWKNYDCVLGFVKKQRVWFWFCEKTSSMISKNGHFPIETNVNSIPLKCEKTTSMIYVLWKNNEYDLRFVKKQRLWFWFCEKTTIIISTLWKNHKHLFIFHNTFKMVKIMSMCTSMHLIVKNIAFVIEWWES